MSKNFAYIYNEDQHNVTSVTIADPTPYKGRKNCLINPDLSDVQHLKRHHWKIEGDRFVPKTEAEKIASDKFHKQNVADNKTVLFVDKIIEVPVEIIKEVQVEVIKEVIKEVPVEFFTEVVKEIIKEVPVEVIKEVEKIVKINVDRVVEKEVIKYKVPKWSIYLNVALGVITLAAIYWGMNG